MSDKKISQLDAASALGGSEPIAVVQSGGTKRTTPDAIATRTSDVLGLGTMATQDSDSVSISGGDVDATSLKEGNVDVVVQTDIGTDPNQVPLNQYLGNLAYQNSNAVVLSPVALVNPIGIGDMVFQLTSDTSLEIKVKGSDGTVRSVALTLA